MKYLRKTSILGTFCGILFAIIIVKVIFGGCMSKSKNAIFEKNRLSEAGYLPFTQSNRKPSPDEWRGLCGSRLAAAVVAIIHIEVA